MSIDTLCALCVAAEDCGNGIIEVTQRGSLQVRGLSESSAPKFARNIASPEIAAESGPPLLTSPLLGMDSIEPFDATEFVSSLRQRLSAHPGLQSLGPKVSVLIDGGGALHLDAIAADIRLVASAEARFLLGIAGNASNAVQLGYVAVGRAAEAVEQLLLRIADMGSSARAKDLAALPSAVANSPRNATAVAYIATADPRNATAVARIATADPRDTPVAARIALAHLFEPAPGTKSARPPAEPLTKHRLVNGTLARGFALPFGHTTANALKRFALAAADHGVTSIRPAPGRALLAIGLSQSSVDKLCMAAEAEGFVVDANDARRHVVTCAGAPACASAKLPTRQLALEVARAASSLVGTSNVLHLSGCSKGCAHPGPAALTIVGPDHVVLNGRARDKPYAIISAAGLAADITRYCNELRHV